MQQIIPAITLEVAVLILGLLMLFAEAFSKRADRSHMAGYAIGVLLVLLRNLDLNRHAGDLSHIEAGLPAKRSALFEIDGAEALDLASEAVGGFRRLLVERPLDASARRGLAAALIRLAEAQSATGDRESAASHAREAIVLAGQALQDDPESYRMKREADDIVSRGAALAAKTPLP